MAHTATLLDGKLVSQKLLQQLEQDLSVHNSGQRPKLVVILVGSNPASEVYVGRKVKVAQQIGMASDLLRFPETLSESDLLDQLAQLNADPTVHAILVQLPLPKHIQSQRVLEAIDPAKDVDGFHPLNMGKLVTGIEPPALPCTPAGMIQLLDYYHLNVGGIRAAVVGRSNIVGKPIALMLTHRNATVTLCHSKTEGLDDILRDSDLVIAAAGQPGLVQAEAIKPGAIVLDVGMNRLATGQLTGDVDFEAACHRAGYITPVPGGVGPMTIAMLMVNTYRLFRASLEQPIEPILFKPVSAGMAI